MRRKITPYKLLHCEEENIKDEPYNARYHGNIGSGYLRMKQIRFFIIQIL